MSREIGIKDIKLQEIDALTRVLRRDCLEKKLHESLCRDRDGESHYSLILFDIDYFKAINDVLGHVQGDEVLRDIGRVLRSFDSEFTQYAGLYGRFGGEEFLVALPFATEQDASEIAEEIRGAVERYDFHDVKTGKTLEEQITITLGINNDDLSGFAGISGTADAKKTLKKMLRKADTALSYGKLLGKNRIAVFSEYLAHEMRNVETVRKFYFEIVKQGKAELQKALGKSRNMKKHQDVGEVMLEHSQIMNRHIDPRDKRTVTVFADELYRKVRNLPCEEKNKIVRFMRYYTQHRYS